MRHPTRTVLLILIALTPALTTGARADEATDADRLIPASWLVLPPVDTGGRAPFNPSRLFERYLQHPNAVPPTAGEAVRSTTGREAAWARVAPDEKGNVESGRMSAAYAAVEAPEAGVWLAEVFRASALYVNGVPHAGDAYGHGLVRTPVKLEKGVNHVYALGFRGRFRVVFTRPPKDVFIAPWDATLPEVVPGERFNPSAGILLVNATEEPVQDLVVTARIAAGPEGLDRLGPRGVYAVAALPPLGTLKVAIRGVPRRLGADVAEGYADVGLVRDGAQRDEHAWELTVREPGDAYRRTFRSDIDGSIQFYGVRKPPGPARKGQGIVLSLHGAGVDARRQAGAYSIHDDFWIVAPTNRRRFGFDWQDWGREDAYEALEDALAWSGLPRSNVHLTGHSMGGHGTWHLAVNDPDGFASVAPSAGWVSFDTYGGRPQGTLTRFWRAADLASDTAALVHNLTDMPIYVLHGTLDDNVPPGQARQMERLLKGVTKDLTVHYAEGKGHWWNGDAAEGTDCVDWPGFFEMFGRARRKTPSAFTRRFADLSLDATHDWLRVDQPAQYGRPCTVTARVEPDAHRVVLETENVRHLAILPPVSLMPRDRGAIVLDGQALSVRPPSPDGLWARDGIGFRRGPGGWAPAPAVPGRGEKRANRMGPFKRAFDRAFVLVYGTAGTTEENAAQLEKARYDAEQWRYRANGRAVCLSDGAYLSRARVYRGRNVVLYGNADTNAAWDVVFPETCPIRPRRGAVHVGVKDWEGEDFGVLLVYPKKGDPEALVAAVAATGVPGMRLTFRVPCFVSGVGIPDFVIFTPRVLSRGDEGVRAAGFFDATWQIAD